MRERGILARMTTRTLPSGARFRLTTREVDYLKQWHELDKNTLNRIGSSPERNKRLLQELLGFSDTLSVLVFGCSVNHAQALALLLRRAGRTAAVITGDTPPALRRRWIEAFRSKEVQFLCNYGVLTTGFDAPQIEVVVIARPTGSVLLYEQMVGRGMRGPKNGGTPECLVVDVVDVIEQFGDQMSYQRYAELWERREDLQHLVQAPG
jgi:superfamily II DNA or RNA helicase